MKVIDENCVLDLKQLRGITLDDLDLMNEVLAALLEDTSKQLVQLAAAIEEQDAQKTMRLAHYCKGACANVGANALATALKRLERQAESRSFAECATSLSSLTTELERLSAKAPVTE